MEITRGMNREELLARMGQDATDEQAVALERELLASGYADTDDIDEAEWLGFLDEAGA